MSFIEILHFNDVYDIEERSQQMKENDQTVNITPGAARFVTAMEQHGSGHKLVLFSGDLFAPSNLSTFFKGA